MGMTVARGVLIVDVADETVELSPTDWVQAQTRKILEAGTTVGIEVLGSPDEEGVDMLSVLRQYNLPLHFPKNRQ